ncbi:MAG: exodeoxyribonuclease VII large subunit [Mycoplasmatota bacterium]|nr:exodeoxyribonuclease VII large subunit [Mycoplasmatota bacterium]
MNDKYITVSQLTRYIKYKIDNDIHLNEVFLKGEISNFKAHTRGHYYFTLKDEGSRINAVMFASATKNIKFLPQDGMKVLVTGKISVFEANGGYQIYVNDMLEDGVGNLYIAFEQLKKKLETEGLFDQKIKKAIPKIPTKVGVVTAPTGAAIKDIVSTIKRRWPLAEIILFPSLVQGEEAAADIVKQIERSKDYNLDTLIVGRGGGSIEDLWPFNEEIVARAIYNCQTPIISAVGHEIDFTIADFVADLRAPTPTGAAELAVPAISDVANYLNQLKIRLNKAISNKITINKQKITELTNRYIFTNPLSIYQTKEILFDSIIERLKYATTNLISLKEKQFLNIKNSYILANPFQLLDKKANRYLQIISKLETLSPLLTLQRGYTMTKIAGKVITSSKNIKKDSNLEIEFSDGSITAKVL